MITNTDQMSRFLDLTSQSMQLVNRGNRTVEEIEWLNGQLQLFKTRTMPGRIKAQITFDNSRPVEKMIRDGRYDKVYSSVEFFSNDRMFPFEKWMKKTTTVVHVIGFGRMASTNEVYREFEALDLRPVKLPELLALGAQHPNLQREFRIVGLVFYKGGSYPWMPVLESESDEGIKRVLGYTNDVGGCWGPHIRFAGVPR